MKLSKIAKQITAAKKGFIFAADGRKWISDGRACYLAEETLPITAENLLAVLDVPKDKREGVVIAEADATDALALVLDIMPQENNDSLLRQDIIVNIGGDDTILLHDAGGRKYAMNATMLDPIECKLPALYARGGYIAVFTDMMCSAIITPEGQHTREIIDRYMMAALNPDVQAALEARGMSDDGR